MRWARTRGAATALAMVMALTILAGEAGGENFWDRKLPDQPTNFIFGYGSLIDSASREATAGKAVPAIPVRVSAAFGYVRCWNDRSPSGFTALGLRRPEPDESALTINGVLFLVEGSDMAAYDRRERGYSRVPVPRDRIEAVSWQRLPAEGAIWAYVPVGAGRKAADAPARPDTDFPLLQSYIDVVLEGGLEYSRGFAREIIETTKDRSAYWLNDREFARRPWVSDSEYAAVDALLAAAPHFNDRLFSEQYAARFLLQK
jgi:hypothetical protein